MLQQPCPYCGFSELQPGVTVCPRCRTEIARDDEPPATRLQSVADLRAELKAFRSPTMVEKPPASGDVLTTPFRPLHRPPMAIVCLFHDGSTTAGEEIPVRGGELVMGRTEGDVTLPHDDQISKRHVRLFRRLEDDSHAWLVQDLDSTNGTFAAIDEGILRQGQELLLGSRRYRFEIASLTNATGLADSGDQRRQTMAWRSLAPSASPLSPPALIEWNTAGEGPRWEVQGAEVTIGSDPNCGIAIAGDPFLSPRHARIARDVQGRWVIKPIQAINGVWVRISLIRVVRSGRFQIGEQRFSVRIP